jgi:transposase
MERPAGTSKAAAGKLVGGMKRKSRKHHSTEKEMRIVLAGLRGEENSAALYRREAIAESPRHIWSKGFPEAGKNCLGGYGPAGDRAGGRRRGGDSRSTEGEAGAMSWLGALRTTRNSQERADSPRGGFSKNQRSSAFARVRSGASSANPPRMTARH